ALCGVAAAVAGRGWRSSRRYEKTPAASEPGPAVAGEQPAQSAREAAQRRRVDQMDAWDELSRGNDPT
ncbi:Trp biosynthesis-associated membrane protein, partial [Micrococcus luteus]